MDTVEYRADNVAPRTATLPLLTTLFALHTFLLMKPAAYL